MHTVIVEFHPTAAGDFECAIELGNEYCDAIPVLGSAHDPAPGCALDPEALSLGRDLASQSGGSFDVTYDRNAAFDGAQVVYAKSWGAWKGREATLAGHADAFVALRDWTVRPSDLQRGAPARFMHCLPVRRNVVVASDVLDGPLSAVLDQAENRVWGQAALLLALLGR